MGCWISLFTFQVCASPFSIMFCAQEADFCALRSGFCLGLANKKASVANRKREGKSDKGIFSLEVLPSRCRLTVARFLYLSRKILPGPPQLQLQLSLDSGNHSFLLPEQTYRSPVVVSLADYLNSAHILQIVDSLNEPNYQSRECHLFPSRTLSDTINKAEYHFRKNKYFLHCLLPVKLSRPLYILFQFIRWKQLFWEKNDISQTWILFIWCPSSITVPWFLKRKLIMRI